MLAHDRHRVSQKLLGASQGLPEDLPRALVTARRRKLKNRIEKTTKLPCATQCGASHKHSGNPNQITDTLPGTSQELPETLGVIFTSDPPRGVVNLTCRKQTRAQKQVNPTTGYNDTEQMVAPNCGVDFLGVASGAWGVMGGELHPAAR